MLAGASLFAPVALLQVCLPGGLGGEGGEKLQCVVPGSGQEVLFVDAGRSKEVLSCRFSWPAVVARRKVALLLFRVASIVIGFCPRGALKLSLSASLERNTRRPMLPS